MTGVSLFGVRTFGNPFSNNVEYRVEYTAKSATMLWGNYTITPHNKLHSTTSERVIGKLPQSIKFTTSKNAIVSANGSTTSQEPITIKIYKNGAECSNSRGTGDAIVSDTIVCR